MKRKTLIPEFLNHYSFFNQFISLDQ